MKVKIHNHAQDKITYYGANRIVLDFMATGIDLDIPLARIRTDLIKGFKIIFRKNKNSYSFSVYPHPTKCKTI